MRNRNLIAFVIAAISIIVMAGCQGDVGSSDTGPAVDPAAKAKNEGGGANRGVADFGEAK